MHLDLPPHLCFRVTRACNARCAFCLAPPDGNHPSAGVLLHRLDWLLDRGVRTLHFCGGEPTLHPALSRLLARTRARGAKVRLTTNGIVLAEDLLRALVESRCQVKVSLHGEGERHDALVGRRAFEPATRNLRRLLAAGVAASVQTTVVAGDGTQEGAAVVEQMARFCVATGVRRLSVLPFLPRGRGAARRGEFGLSGGARRAVHDRVRALRRAYAGRLDVRWLDFTARPFHVVEADGRIVLEGASEAMDEVLGRIPVVHEGASS